MGSSGVSSKDTEGCEISGGDMDLKEIRGTAVVVNNKYSKRNK